MTNKQSNESNEAFITRVIQEKLNGTFNVTWNDVADFIYNNTGIARDESTWRKKSKEFFQDDDGVDFDEGPVNPTQEEQLQELINEFQIERVKLSDVNNQNRAYLRRIAREETIKEIAMEAADKVANVKALLPTDRKELKRNSDNEAILQLSDWHFGIEIENYWNKFNPQICKQRVTELVGKTLLECEKFDISKIYVVNLSDLIAGRIHASIRYESRCDVITQTMTVAEILAEVLYTFYSYGMKVEYYDCLDNHSRLEPIKSDSLDLESLVRIIPWYLKERFKEIKNGVVINTNTYDADIIDFYALNGKYRVAGVHGHKDRPGRVVEGLTTMTKEHFDLILTAHLHHFQCDELNDTIVVSNGSLMGTDSYAKNLRLCSQPSQNLIILSEDSVIDYIKRIPLN